MPIINLTAHESKKNTFIINKNLIVEYVPDAQESSTSFSINMEFDELKYTDEEAETLAKEFLSMALNAEGTWEFLEEKNLEIKGDTDA